MPVVRGSILRFIALLCGLWPLFCAGQSVVLHDALVEIAPAAQLMYLEDPSGTLEIADLLDPGMAHGFQPLRADNEEINFGYSASAYWLRLELSRPAEASPGARWLLEVAFPWLDLVELYSPQPSGECVGALAGDLLPWEERPFAHRNFVFPLEVRPGASAVFFLRVSSQGSLTLPLTLWQQDAFSGTAATAMRCSASITACCSRSRCTTCCFTSRCASRSTCSTWLSSAAWRSVSWLSMAWGISTSGRNGRPGAISRCSSASTAPVSSARSLPASFSKRAASRAGTG